MSPALTVSMPEKDIALITMDLPDTGANILNDQLFRELDETMASLAERDDLAGVILFSAKPSIFVAGADLNNIVAHLDWPDEEIVRFCEKGRAVMARFSRCPFVSVAAIHGACVGGGLELALWCDYRIASDHRRTVLGLPEVKLGLVPGWAGTARLPRIAGLDVGLDLVTSGRLVSANEALEMKFVDAVVEQDTLIGQSIACIRRVQTSQAFVASRRAIMGSVSGIPTDDPQTAVEIIGKSANRHAANIVGNREIFPFAPTVVLEHMTRTASLGMKEAWDSESLAMAQVWGSPASRGLLNNFFLSDRNKKNPGLVDLDIETPAITSVGIVGAGLMGRSIASACIQSGIDVMLLDADNALADSVAKSLKDSIGKKAKGTLTAIQNYEDFQSVSLVIESVVESISVKQIVLERIEAAIPETTLIATNTSAIPIGSLSPTLKQPGRFCGIHFCHPELMSLVEVICGPETEEPTVTSAVRFVQSLRMMPVAINDGPGFVVNRLLAAMMNQSLRLFVQGVEIKDIDEAFVDFGFLGGPFEIFDVVGLDTCMYAGRTMWEAKLDCVSLSPILPKLVKHGRLGRKSGRGFYSYQNLKSDERGAIDPDLMPLIQSYRDVDASRKGLDRKSIIRQVLAAVALEATRIVGEEMVGDPRDIDLCVINGFSFPKHQGGILFWSDQQTWQTIKETLYQFSDDDPSMEPTSMLKDYANQRKTFYAPPADSN